MTAYEQAIIKVRRALLGIEARVGLVLQAVYAETTSRLQANVEDLTRRIAEANRLGEHVKPSWLYRQERYRLLIGQLEHDTATAAGVAAGAVTSGQRAAVTAAPQDAADLAVHAVGPGAQGGDAIVRGAFLRTPPAALDAFVGRSVAGTPLDALLLELAPDTVDRVKGTLAYAVATGQSPRETARAVRDEANVTLTRALTISRTEIIGAYRAATTVAYRQAGVKQWRWYAATGSERTCMVCLAMHWSLHPVSESFASHPACRCCACPEVSWADFGFPGVNDQRPALETGEQAFARLTRPEQLKVVGPERLRLLEAGTIRLPDLVRKTHSKRWGPGRRPATLTELAA